MSKKALIVEDDANIADLIRLYLEKDGWDILICSNGEAAVIKAKSESPDLILLDIMLPKKDGIQVCKEVRSFSQASIVILTAKSEMDDKINGLESGADDYITKPFEPKELLARIHAVTRRTSLSGSESQENKESNRLEFDKLIIDMNSYELIVDGNKINTPPKEMELLYFLTSSPNRVFTRNQLLDKVWGFDYFGDSRTVDVHIKRLREKLEIPDTNWELKTVWGVGYKFELEQD